MMSTTATVGAKTSQQPGGKKVPVEDEEQLEDYDDEYYGEEGEDDYYGEEYGEEEPEEAAPLADQEESEAKKGPTSDELRLMSAFKMTKPEAGRLCLHFVTDCCKFSTNCKNKHD